MMWKYYLWNQHARESKFAPMNIELYSASLCPFAHRTRLTLAEKGVAPRLIEVDLRNKPRWFSALSPHGKVPLLRMGEAVVWEAAVIDEYLEEVLPQPALLPRDPLTRARVRAWIRFADTRLYENTRRLLYARNAAGQSAACDAVIADLWFMEQEAFVRTSSSGPYWLGHDYSLADVTFLPWFEQRIVLEQFRGFAWPENCDRLLKWYDEMARRPAVQAQSRPAEFYLTEVAALVA
jgi:glutathione S-transferase